MTTDVSVATDLGALLRESIDTGLGESAKSSGHVPVQLGPLPESGVALSARPVGPRVPTPGAFSVVPFPDMTPRGVTVDAAPKTTPAPKRRGSGIVTLLLTAAALAAVMGGGAAYYVHRHHTKLAVTASAPAREETPAPVAKDLANEPPAPAAVEPKPEAQVAAPAPVAAATPEPEAKPSEPVIAPKVKRTAHVAAKVAEPPKAEPTKPAKVERAEKVEASPRPAAPKPAAGGAVDAVLQQQLSGAIP